MNDVITIITMERGDNSQVDRFMKYTMEWETANVTMHGGETLTIHAHLLIAAISI